MNPHPSVPANSGELPVRESRPAPRHWLAWAGLAGLVLLLCPGCNFVFFQPNDRFYHAPGEFGLRHEEVWFESADGTRLHGWFLPALAPAKGTIVHFHGNAANITNHLLAVRWLPRAGYAVLLFDYRGYGRSEGEPDRAGAIADGVAAIRFARGRPGGRAGRLIVYGQSLGGAVAVSALAEAGTEGVGLLILEGAFGSYRTVAQRKIGGFWPLWPFQYPLAWLLFSDGHNPEEAALRLAGLPVLAIHREEDGTVPFASGRELYEALPGPDKTFWAVPGEGHIVTFAQPEPGWRERLVKFLDEKLSAEEGGAGIGPDSPLRPAPLGDGGRGILSRARPCGRRRCTRRPSRSAPRAGAGCGGSRPPCRARRPGRWRPFAARPPRPACAPRQRS